MWKKKRKRKFFYLGWQQIKICLILVSHSMRLESGSITEFINDKAPFAKRGFVIDGSIENY